MNVEIGAAWGRAIPRKGIHKRDLRYSVGNREETNTFVSNTQLNSHPNIHPATQLPKVNKHTQN